jgi:hypothetical protein
MLPIKDPGNVGKIIIGIVAILVAIFVKLYIH